MRGDEIRKHAVAGRTALTAAASLALLLAASPGRAADPVADSHFHVGNYAMQGISLRRLLDSYLADGVSRAAVFGIPLQQKWDRFEHFEGDRIPPNYYIGPKAGMYYYAFIDAMVALDYLRLPTVDRARLDPMIVGFNPMDQYGVDHVKRCLLLFPGVFTGVGEITVHKEIVGEKIDDDLLPRSVSPLGILVATHPDHAYVPGLVELCRSEPRATVIWAHTGLGRFVRPPARHLRSVGEVLDACPSWSVDLSWDVVQEYLVHPEAEMPSLADWSAFLTRYQDRVLWGSDAVAFTRNRIDGEGRPVLGTALPVPEYQRMVRLLAPLWTLVGPDVTAKVRHGNHARLFDASRRKVRAWEAAHAGDDPWSLPQGKE